MPLVQRTSLQGNFFQEDTEPTNWNNADIWADTNSSPRALFINNNGTALELGSTSLDDEGSDNDHDTTTVLVTEPIKGINNPGTSYTTRSSITLTVANSNSVVALFGYAKCYTNRAAGVTVFTKILDGAGAAIAETSKAVAQFNIDGSEAFGVITGVSSGEHTFNLQSKLSLSTSLAEVLINTGVYAAILF